MITFIIIVFLLWLTLLTYKLGVQLIGNLGLGCSCNLSEHWFPVTYDVQMKGIIIYSLTIFLITYWESAWFDVLSQT